MKKRFNFSAGNRPLAPGFINRLDAWLLRNYPDIWATRAHLALYYILLFAVAVFIVCGVLPDDPRTRSAIEIRFGLTVTFAAVLFIVGLIFLFRFNVFKRFGHLTKGDRLRNFLLFYLVLVILGGVCFLPFVIEELKADEEYSNQELIDDTNTANLCIGLLEKEKRYLEIRVDTMIFVATYDDAILKNDALNRPDSLSAYHNPYTYHYKTSSELEDELRTSDIAEKLGDTGYVITNYGNLIFIGENEYYSYYAFEESEKQELYTNHQLYQLIYEQEPKYSKPEARKLFSELTNKYYLRENDPTLDDFGQQQVPYNSDTWNSDDRIRFEYKTEALRSAIYNIKNRKKHFSYRNLIEVLLGLIYIALAITLALFIFRHMTIKTFFVSILAGLVISILFGFIGAFFQFRELGFSFVYFFLFALFFGIALTTPTAKRRSIVHGIAINLSILMVFALPILVVALCEYFDMRSYSYDYNSIEYDLRRKFWMMWVYLSQGIGGILLLLMIHFVYSKLYRIWYAQPEE